MRTFLPNPLDFRLKRGAKNILVCWNRGLGDIPLGLYAILHRIDHFLPAAKVTFLVRANLCDGMSMLEGVETLAAPDWKRGEPYDVQETLQKLGRRIEEFDLVLERPSPSDWCRWQYGKITPRLRWDKKHDALWKRFALPEGFTYVGVQVSAETNYGFWRNWPESRWQELFDKLGVMGSTRVILFGYGEAPKFSHPMLIDLRGKTSLFELLSIIQNKCSALVLPDSGILSMAYYLDVSFPLRVISLWADPKHGILKQNVPSPNPQLVHIPLIGEHRNLSSVSAEQVMEACFPKRQLAPMRSCVKHSEVQAAAPLEKAACVILAGGQGSRLNVPGPKGLFPLGSKSLFQHLIEKVPSSMPVAIMTSPLNHEETVRYFTQHKQFGKKISFFCQDVLPLLDENYKEIGTGPDGNGGVYQKLISSGILDAWEKEGVDTVLLVPVENPLADPADKILASYHRSQGADVTIKCIERRPRELMGLIVEEKGKLDVAEYFMLDEEPFFQSYSYMGQLALSTSFIRRAAAIMTPYRWVKKRLPVQAHEMWAWKRERFLFDAFSIAQKTAALCYPREMCYAPVKGPESVAEATRAVEKKTS
ncbi:MAG TPA: UTP--glucose-1-phosphate uridylyltransferase [Chlamydiales bacterium]|jgi:UDP-N-acetylglucosamine/UDP-N-acetylgalactosamine diphosphorylase